MTINYSAFHIRDCTALLRFYLPVAFWVEMEIGFLLLRHISIQLESSSEGTTFKHKMGGIRFGVRVLTKGSYSLLSSHQALNTLTFLVIDSLTTSSKVGKWAFFKKQNSGKAGAM